MKSKVKCSSRYLDPRGKPIYMIRGPEKWMVIESRKAQTLVCPACRGWTFERV